MELPEFITEIAAIVSEVQVGTLRYADGMDKIRVLAQKFADCQKGKRDATIP